jgi:hypothetical protein
MAEHEWLHTFQRKAAPRLRALLERDLDGLPQHIKERLDRLREVEAQKAQDRGETSSDEHSTTAAKIPPVQLGPRVLQDR